MIELKKNEMFCPRCMGKGFVDLNDIRRLDRQLEWGLGYCRYCDGQGFVERGKTKKINPRNTDLGPDFHEIDIVREIRIFSIGKSLFKFCVILNIIAIPI